MFAVIMAGGSGTRFWPMSRKKRPKQFLSISGHDPMIVETCDRLHPLIKDEEMIIVLGKDHYEEAAELLHDRAIHILAEPMGRNTAPCIGLGAIYAQERGCVNTVAFVPADHYIGNPKAFLDSLNRAGEVAESGGIVTLGIIPTRPETGYGYIQKSEEHVGSIESPIYRVSAFVEKPDAETAHQYLSSGQYFWNAGIFIARPEVILQEIKQYLPNLYQGLERIRKVIRANDFEKECRSVYSALSPISFDYGIMEKTQIPLFVLSCDCGWSDVGSWESLYELRNQDYDRSNNYCEGEAILIDSKNSFISSASGRLVTCLGIDNCLVVDTPDALLVADLNKAQDIRQIVEQLKEKGKENLL